MTPSLPPAQEPAPGLAASGSGPASAWPARLLGPLRCPSAPLVRRLTLATLVANIVIVVTGGAVRLTSSGLGCPTFPTCTNDSLVPTPAMGTHGVIEFGNRLLTWVLVAVTAATLVAVTRRRPRRVALVRLSWALLAGIFAQALLGGITVLTGLNPVTVMGHFMLSIALIGLAALLHVRAGEGDLPARVVVRPQVLITGRLLVAVTALMVLLGTVVTGSGPHSGDRDAIHRLPISPASAAQMHADSVFLMLGLTIALLVLMPVTGAPPLVARRTRQLLAISLAQGVIGYVQYFTKLPAVLVALHMLGATLVWVAAVRVLLAMRDRGPAVPSSESPPTLPASIAATSGVSLPRTAETLVPEAPGVPLLTAARRADPHDPAHG